MPKDLTASREEQRNKLVKDRRRKEALPRHLTAIYSSYFLLTIQQEHMLCQQIRHILWTAHHSSKRLYIDDMRLMTLQTVPLVPESPKECS
jgi:hypothetical protein